jgi:cobalt-precorrin 5A hydrolase
MQMTETRKEYAIYVITKHGLEIGKRILAVLKDADLYVSPKFIAQAPQGSKLLSLPMEPTLRDTFQSYNCHIHVISVGAVVRMIAPLLVNKKVDPAIVCVDDKANFSICVLSGHVGRGNFYTQEVSAILKNTAVITTASDVSGTLTVDILGRALGWTLENADRNVTRGCAAVVNETRVAFVQECGEPEWWPIHQNLPKSVEYYRSLDEVDPDDFEILLIASDRSNLSATHPRHYANSVIYRPKSLILGIGCDRDTPFELLERGILKILGEQGLDLASVKALASVDAKKEEAGILELVRKYGWEFKTYPPETLDQVAGIENPSDMPKQHVGTRSVSEAAALLRAEAYRLLVPKQKYREEERGKNMTIAIARMEFPVRLVSQLSPAQAEAL